MLHQHVARHKQCNLLIITPHWTVCRQLRATLWQLTSLFVFDIRVWVYWALPSQICSYVLSSRQSISPLVVKSQRGRLAGFNRLLKYYVVRRNGYIFTLFSSHPLWGFVRLHFHYIEVRWPGTFPQGQALINPPWLWKRCIRGNEHRTPANNLIVFIPRFRANVPTEK